MWHILHISSSLVIHFDNVLLQEQFDGKWTWLDDITTALLQIPAFWIPEQLKRLLLQSYKTQVEDLIMLINFEPSCWCLFSISTEFYYIEASALKKKKGNVVKAMQPMTVVCLLARIS